MSKKIQQENTYFYDKTSKKYKDVYILEQNLHVNFDTELTDKSYHFK